MGVNSDVIWREKYILCELILRVVIKIALLRGDTIWSGS
jgi:hypothetical protein